MRNDLGEEPEPRRLPSQIASRLWAFLHVPRQIPETEIEHPERFPDRRPIWDNDLASTPLAPTWPQLHQSMVLVQS
jgi:hypothetical protein